jgi:DNA-binding transcriptional ArsR family regulator
MDTTEDRKGRFPLDSVSFVLASPSRWRLLEALSEGGPFSVDELARRIGLKPSTASKHMLILAKAGLAKSGKGRLYTLAPGLLAADGSRDVALGRCTLHFGGGE